MNIWLTRVNKQKNKKIYGNADEQINRQIIGWIGGQIKRQLWAINVEVNDVSHCVFVCSCEMLRIKEAQQGEECSV